ncbi:MAG: hypothetical protein K2M07_04825 [Muribaculaceae bacterium]|nr:hypothetical protein [Muribaculaceae bacterium]
MIIIADSSSTRTEWVLVDGDKVVEKATTGGMNPYFQTRREISHSIRLELPELFFKKRWEHVYYYGAGCSNPEKCKIMESSLVAQFKTPVTVESDLLGAARGLLVRKPGLACIIGTGSNSCNYDGEKIVKNIRPLGYVLGDEGSGAYIGKRFIADCLKGLAPVALTEQFISEYSIEMENVLDEIYIHALASVLLSSYSNFLLKHLDDEYVRDLIYNSFMEFFRRNIAAYDYKNHPVSFVGSVACNFSEILQEAARDFNVEVLKIVPSSMPGLVEYHTTV